MPLASRNTRRKALCIKMDYLCTLECFFVAPHYENLNNEKSIQNLVISALLLEKSHWTSRTKNFSLLIYRFGKLFGFESRLLFHRRESMNYIWKTQPRVARESSRWEILHSANNKKNVEEMKNTEAIKWNLLSWENPFSVPRGNKKRNGREMGNCVI